MSRLAVPTPVPKPTVSYWIKAFPDATKPIAPRPGPSTNGSLRPSLPEAADVVIIGGGIAGVSTAYHLRKCRPDLQVVLMEARQLSHGATGRNGGLLWPALNAPWIKTAERYGTTEASRMMAFELQCLAEVTAFIHEQGLEQEVRYAPFADGGYYMYEGQEEMEGELAELEIMQRFGIHSNVVPLTRRQVSAMVGSEAFAGAVKQPGVARVWAARLVHAIARLAAETGAPGGLVLAENTRVAAVTPLPDGAPQPALELFGAAEELRMADWEAHQHLQQLRHLEGQASGNGNGNGKAGAANNILPVQAGVAAQVKVGARSEALHAAAAPLLQVTTDAGETVLARRVVHCTNAYGSSLLPELRAALVPVRNHVAATRSPAAGGATFPLDAAFFARGGYVYWSRREDGRTVVGGFRDVVPGLEWGVYDDASLNEAVRHQLHAYLPERFPGVYGSELAPEVEWSGILGFTQDRFPYVGPVPGRRGQFVAAGFSGHGMTRTFTCGRVLADMIAGVPYDPNFPASWLPSTGRFGPAQPTVPGPEAAAGAVYVQK